LESYSIDDPYPGIFLLLNEIISLPPSFYIYNGLVLLLLLFLSALVSGSEVAFFSLTSNELASIKSTNKQDEHNVVKLLKRPKELLATILILNNLVNVAIVTFSTYLSWQMLGVKTTGGMVVVTLTLVITFAIVFFGEVVPKVYANVNSLSLAKKTAPLLNLSAKILRPFSWLLMSLSNIVEKRVEIKGYHISVDELNHALEITTSEHTSIEERGILKGIVNFGTLTVRQVMRSRMDITAVDIEDDFHELMDQINKNGYSRIPVYRETIDKIEGILYIKDLLPYLDNNESFPWQRLLRPGFFIPETKKVDSLLKDFQEKRVHMAIVVDEYGGTSGLITLEDIIEEIVGEINDEFDNEDIIYNKLDDNTYVFEGKTSLNDFCKVVNADISEFESVKGESESLGGLLLEIASKMPRAGEKIHFSKFVFTVVSVDARRIKRIRVLIADPIAKETLSLEKEK
jgi:putative hemolysin